VVVQQPGGILCLFGVWSRSRVEVCRVPELHSWSVGASGSCFACSSIVGTCDALFAYARLCDGASCALVLIVVPLK
jgi:hypothetical protein